MIQGGDPTGTGMGGESIYGEAFEDEFSRDVFQFAWRIVNGKCWSLTQMAPILCCY